MTYTFKLARRLAASRTLGMLPALLLFAACSGDTTAPDSSPAHPLTSGSPTDPRFRQTAPLTVSINPSSVTVETNQLIRFLAIGRNSAGDSVAAPIVWSASGGTILDDGRFSSASLGSFMVTGRTRTVNAERLDTAYVKVVRRQPNLRSISVAPAEVTLAAGGSQAFLVTGKLKDGSAVPVGVTWSAAGGTIDAGGNYVAGNAAGTYLVIATSTSRSLSDTAVVTVTAPVLPAPTPEEPVPPADSTPVEPTPEAPPPAEEPPAPTLATVTLLPATATLAPSTTKQFRTYGTTTTGDSVAVSVVFSATGGTVTVGGLYTAPSTAGTYRVIAKTEGVADTSTITVTVPLGSGPGTGIPYGPFAGWDNTVLKSNTDVFSATIGSVGPSNIVERIAAARSKGKKLILAMAGGHDPYLTDGVFDRAKWNAAMQTYNTATIRDAVAKGVADGTIVGNSVMDEPHVHGYGDGNTWGPAGTMTKARVDSMCGYVKAIFPTLPAGVVHQHLVFEPEKSYKVCEFLVSQYSGPTKVGDVTAFRDGGLAYAKRDGMAIAFSMNILNGGIQAARDGLWNCPLTTTGGRGTFDPNCRMTAAQVREFGITLGLAGCAMVMWRYDDTFMANPDNVQAFKDVASKLAAAPAKSCRRP
jgi:hypothetical protein